MGSNELSERVRYLRRDSISGGFGLVMHYAKNIMLG